MEMTGNNRELLLYLLKALADDTRLKMLLMLTEQERNAGELAELLGVTEPTVSHHLGKLRSTGFVNLRTVGNQRIYRANSSRINDFRHLVNNLEHIPYKNGALASDDSWIDNLDMDDDQKKILRDYTRNGRLRQIPTKSIKLIVVLDWLVTRFEPDVIYTESEVNEILRQYHEDFAGLRRELVDYGYLRRERAGTKYWLTPENEDVP